jgi:hypothetical protein
VRLSSRWPYSSPGQRARQSLRSLGGRVTVRALAAARVGDRHRYRCDAGRCSLGRGSSVAERALSDMQECALSGVEPCCAIAGQQSLLVVAGLGFELLCSLGIRVVALTRDSSLAMLAGIPGLAVLEATAVC